MGSTTRRGLLLGGLAALLPGSTAAAKPTVPPIPLAVAVAARRAKRDGRDELEPVVTRAFIDEQLAEANTIFGAHALSFVEAETSRALDERFARLETRADRDELASALLSGVVNVFFVESLRDVDDPSLYRMGVTWRNLKNLKKKYVVVAASARPTTLAHELGHYLGNDHTYVKNNLMSYDRDGGEVTLSAAQGERSRRTALGLFAQKQLVAR